MSINTMLDMTMGVIMGMAMGMSMGVIVDMAMGMAMDTWTHNGNRKWDAQANLAKLHIFDLIDFYEWIQYIDILAKGYD